MKQILFISLILLGCVVTACGNQSKQDQETADVMNEEESFSCLCCPPVLDEPDSIADK